MYERRHRFRVDPGFADVEQGRPGAGAGIACRLDRNAIGRHISGDDHHGIAWQKLTEETNGQCRARTLLEDHTVDVGPDIHGDQILPVIPLGERRTDEDLCRRVGPLDGHRGPLQHIGKFFNQVRRTDAARPLNLKTGLRPNVSGDGNQGSQLFPKPGVMINRRPLRIERDDQPWRHTIGLDSGADTTVESPVERNLPRDKQGLILCRQINRSSHRKSMGAILDHQTDTGKTLLRAGSHSRNKNTNHNQPRNSHGAF